MPLMVSSGIDRLGFLIHDVQRLLRKRFEIACRRHGFGRARELRLDASRFVPPRKPSPQGELF